jgi:Uma2 family endonuclease
MTIATLMTSTEFEAFLAQNDGLWELIHGEIIAKMPTEQHGVIAANIVRHIGNFIEEKSIDGYWGVEIRHQKQGDSYNVRMPDVSFRFAKNAMVTQGAVAQMPDFAVEIQSPDDDLRDMREKAEYYLRNGARLVWLIFPKTRTIEIRQLDDDGVVQIRQLSDKDLLDGDGVFVGLSLPVAKIFPKT